MDLVYVSGVQSDGMGRLCHYVLKKGIYLYHLYHMITPLIKPIHKISIRHVT